MTWGRKEKKSQGADPEAHGTRVHKTTVREASCGASCGASSDGADQEANRGPSAGDCGDAALEADRVESDGSEAPWATTLGRLGWLPAAT